jgi:hypothetical protein
VAKRICIIFPDQSITLFSGSEGKALAAARHELAIWNKDPRQPKAQMGEIEVDLMSFRERC